MQGVATIWMDWRVFTVIDPGSDREGGMYVCKRGALIAAFLLAQAPPRLGARYAPIL